MSKGDHGAQVAEFSRALTAGIPDELPDHLAPIDVKADIIDGYHSLELGTKQCFDRTSYTRVLAIYIEDFTETVDLDDRQRWFSLYKLECLP